MYKKNFNFDDYVWDRPWYWHNREFRYGKFCVDLAHISRIRVSGDAWVVSEVHPIYKAGEFVGAVSCRLTMDFMSGMQVPLLSAMEALDQYDPPVVGKKRPDKNKQFVVITSPLLEASEELPFQPAVPFFDQYCSFSIHDGDALSAIRNYPNFRCISDAAPGLVVHYCYYRPFGVYFHREKVAELSDLGGDATQLSPTFWEKMAELSKEYGKLPYIALYPRLAEVKIEKEG